MLTPDELAALPPDVLGKAFTQQTLDAVYDYETHVRIGEALEARGALPSTFMALNPGSNDPDVWHDINRMLTLNGDQTRKGLENHVCPLQFDIVDRLIERYSQKGELVFDPFGGLFTVPYRALKAGRRGRAVELNPSYFLDGIKYLQSMEADVSMPSLFDFLEAAE
jgi:DNA modification methylase